MKPAWLVRSLPWLLAVAPVICLTALGARAQQSPAAPVPPPSSPQPSQVVGQVLTLQEAIKIGLETQPDIQARLADYAAAQERVAQALSPLLPQLSGTWTANRQKTEFFAGSIGRVGAGPTALLSTNQTAQVTLSQILFDFGKIFAATDVARAKADVARLEAEDQKDTVILAVKQGYFRLLLAERLVAVNEQAAARAELNLRNAKGFFEVGTRPKFDVTRAEVDLANAQVTLIQARNAASLGRVALNTAMGIAVDAPMEVEDILAYEPYVVDQAQLIPEALRQRPDYRRVNALVTSAEASLRRAFRDFFPDISGSGSYDGRFRNPRTPLDDLAEEWQLALTLNWTIFDGGNKIARYREAKKNIEAARSGVRSIQLSISQAVVQAHLNLQETDQRIAAARKAVESAEENFRLAQGRFAAGVGTILELTDAQLALTQAQATHTQALADHHIAIATLERALGRR